MPQTFLERLGLTLALAEKYLLKHGWRVRDLYDEETRVFFTYAEREDEENAPVLRYPKPTYHYPTLDPKPYLDVLLDALARYEACDRAALETRVRAVLDEFPEGYSCRVCGHCCRALRDAHQGRVSAQEVAVWRAMGLDKLLSFVKEERGQGYIYYTAWVHPKTGKFFRKCPWLYKVDGEPRHLCRIHEVKPLKCRAFPLWREQAERAHCPGFDPAP
jgi:Fe-S-cluster containining protein